MKNLRVSLIMLVSISLVISSCKEYSTTDNKVEEETVLTEIKEDVKADQIDKIEVMMHATPLPRYMSVVLSNKEVLDIDKKQYQQLTKISKDKSPQAVEMAYKIGEIEKDIYQLSLDNAKKELLVTKFEKALELRTILATMKLDCRDKVMEILNEQQWNDLITLYQEKIPFDSKFIQNDDIKLDKEQEEKLSEWSKVNHPKMMEMANKVIAYEKNIYKLSMNKAPREDILNNITEIANIKRQIISTKTDCRDNLISNIVSEEQWKELSSK